MESSRKPSPRPAVRRLDADPPPAIVRQVAFLARRGIRPEIAGVLAGLAFSVAEGCSK